MACYTEAKSQVWTLAAVLGSVTEANRQDLALVAFIAREIEAKSQV